MTSSQTVPSFPGLTNLFSRQRRRKLAVTALLAVGMSAQLTPVLAEGTSLGSGLEATPLVLKDGRIARVSIHTIPFPDDGAALASATQTELEAFTQAMATDCFLTAQVIGHVDKKETEGRDTVDIHRLARSRADTIQEALITNGLPAASIASVWDWQFMVEDARATLWMFQLAAGDDCSEEALSTATNDQVAAIASEPAKVADTKQPADVAKKPVEQRVIAAAPKTAPEVTKPIPAAVKKPSTPVKARQQIKQAVAPTSAKPAATPAPSTVVAAIDPEAAKKGRVILSETGALEITFATNSSYLPQGWKNELGSFLERLNQGESYVVRVQTSIDGDARVAGTSSDDEAAKYNRWMAERRFERVKAWLLKNSEGSTLQIENTELNNDGSRRVKVELNPLG